MLDEVMIKYAEILNEDKREVQQVEASMDLLPNTFPELDITTPSFLSSEIYTTAADEDVDRLYEKKFPKEIEDMIEQAHPDDVFVSPALGDGGLVENQNQQQEKTVNMINKMPTGHHVHIYADVLKDLVKVANELEDTGFTAFAGRVDAILEEFDGDLKKKVTKTAGPFLIGGIMALLGGGAQVGLHGIPEGLVEDATDALDVAEEFPAAFPGSIQRAQLVYEGTQELVRLSREASRLFDSGDRRPATAQKLAQLLEQSQATLRKVQNATSALETIEASLPYVGYIDRFKSHLGDYQKSLNAVVASLTNLGQSRTRKLPGQEEVERIREERRHQPSAVPMRQPTQTAVKPSLSDEGKQRVMSFLEKVKPGVIEKNLDERLDDYANRLAKAIKTRTGVTVDNLTGERLKNADEATLKKLLQFAKEPLTSIDYVPAGME